jgi:hypothetical protein
MLHHRAYGRDLDTLVVAVVDNRRPILSLMRAMLAAIGTGRIETYESPTEAVDAMAKGGARSCHRRRCHAAFDRPATG